MAHDVNTPGGGSGALDPEAAFEQLSRALGLDMPEAEGTDVDRLWESYGQVTAHEAALRTALDEGRTPPWSTGQSALVDLARNARTVHARLRTDPDVPDLATLIALAEACDALVEAATGYERRRVRSPEAPSLERARALAARGLAVFPITPGQKSPPIGKFTEIATTQDDQLAELFAAHPHANIGVHAGRSGLLIIDLDAKEGRETTGLETLRDLAAGRSLPSTFTVRSPSGGYHMYYRVPAGTHLPLTVERLGPNVDTRTDNGYVVAPGSRLREGGTYVLERDLPVAAAPDWLIAEVQRKTAVEHVRPALTPGEIQRIEVSDPRATVTRVLDDVGLKVAEAPSGRRNDILYKQALRLGRYLEHQQINEGQARSLLYKAALRADPRAGNEERRKIHTTITNGFRAGRAQPIALAAKPAPSPRSLPIRRASGPRGPVAVGSDPASLPRARTAALKYPAVPRAAAADPGPRTSAPTTAQQALTAVGTLTRAPAARTEADPDPYRPTTLMLAQLLDELERMPVERAAEIGTRLAQVIDRACVIAAERRGQNPLPHQIPAAAAAVSRASARARHAVPPDLRALVRNLDRLAASADNGDPATHANTRRALTWSFRALTRAVEREGHGLERDPNLTALARTTNAAALSLTTADPRQFADLASSDEGIGRPVLAQVRRAEQDLYEQAQELLNGPIADAALTDRTGTDLLYRLQLRAAPSRWAGTLTENLIRGEVAWRREGAAAAGALARHLQRQQTHPDITPINALAGNLAYHAVRLESAAARRSAGESGNAGRGHHRPGHRRAGHRPDRESNQGDHSPPVALRR